MDQGFGAADLEKMCRGLHRGAEFKACVSPEMLWEISAKSRRTRRPPPIATAVRGGSPASASTLRDRDYPRRGRAECAGVDNRSN